MATQSENCYQTKIFACPEYLNAKLPKVDIVVSNYNYSNYIIDCLQAIEKQTYKNWHCIVVDDCSTDNSNEVISGFIKESNHSDKFSFISTIKNGGQMEAIKRGLQEATGDFVTLVDADDILYHDFLEAHLYYHLNAKFPHAFSCSNQIQIKEDRTILAGVYNRYFLFEELTYLEPFNLFEKWAWTSMGAALFRRPVLDLILPTQVRDELRICADFYLFHFANLIGGTIMIPEFHGAYRRHGKNNFCANSIVSGYANPGDVRREPNQETMRYMILSQVQERYEDFLTIYANYGIERIVEMVAINAWGAKKLMSTFPFLFAHKNYSKPNKTEQDMAFLHWMYKSKFRWMMLVFIRPLSGLKHWLYWKVLLRNRQPH